MSNINFLKPDKLNLNTFLYLGSFLFLSDLSLNSRIVLEANAFFFVWQSYV